MANFPSHQAQFDKHNCCVLIPTYNNAATLERVLNEVLQYTKNLLVVNDGSTDGTANILDNYNIPIIDIPANRGKGNALKTGFKAAEDAGFSYAVTMDSDGQHFPDDIPLFLEALDNKVEEGQEMLIIGSRKMDDPSVPEKSSFGNRCSTYWFWFVTGIHLKDTQCGYRLYPLHIVNQLPLITSKFELEIEVIVQAAWRNVEVRNMPVKVLYDPEERVTHFRPFQDVARITLLNILFVFMSLFFYHPRNFLRKIFSSEKTEVSKRSFSDPNLPLE